MNIKKLLPIIVILILLSIIYPCFSDDGSSVIVIYNSKVPVSRDIALHYAKARQVPENQLLGFDLPADETITRLDFQTRLEEPLLKKIFAMGLFESTTNQAGKVMLPPKKSKIRFAVLCYGVPLKILESKDIVEKNIDDIPPELRRNEASVDSELICLPRGPWTYRLTGPLLSHVYMGTNNDLLHPTNGILIVSRLDGPTPQIVSNIIDNTIIAEKEGLWGNVYIDRRGITNGILAEGEKWFANSALWCRRLGFETIEDVSPETFDKDFPMSHIAVYIGWYDENVSGPFTKEKVEFVPGALAYHLHSFSCEKLRTKSERWVGPLLAKGATCSMGSVNEPGLGGTPNIFVFLIHFLLRGSTFGESFIFSQHSFSWQNVAIGDPLYCPFKKNLEEWQREMEKVNSPNLQWVHLRWVNINLSAGRSPETMIDYIEKLRIARKSPILQEKLGDLYLMDKKYSDSLSSYEEALKLQCSDNQRIRIALKYVDGLLSLGSKKKAFDFLSNFQKDYPSCAQNRYIIERYNKLEKELSGAGK